MRHARWMALLLVASACSSFGANDSGDVSGADAGTIDGGAPVPVEAGPGGDAGRPAPGTVVSVRKERDVTRGVSVTPERIYWWSVQDARIASVAKAQLDAVDTTVTRKGQTVTAVGADASGVYWLEAGRDTEDGGTTDRIMKQEGMVTTVLLRATSPLRHLALTPSHVFSTAPGALAIVPKGGGGSMRPLGIDQNALTQDGTYAFYTFANSNIYRATDVYGAEVIQGLAAPHSLVTDSNSLYAVITDGTGNAIVKIDKNATMAAASAATVIMRVAPGPTFLAIDNLGVIWGNADDGKVQRVPRTGGTATLVASGATGMNALVADTDGVYWTTDDGTVGWAVRP